jgi:hypothetical protein
LVFKLKLFIKTFIMENILISQQQHLTLKETTKMNLNLLKTIVLVLTASHQTLTIAHELTGASLGSAQNATDLYQVTCSKQGSQNTSYLEASVKANTANVPVSLQLQKGFKATNTSDQTGADNTSSSAITLIGGNGVYLMLADKQTSTLGAYGIEYHCKSASGIHTNTTISTKQSQ